MRRWYKGADVYWTIDDGEKVVISDGAGWLPGTYENEEAADLAHQIKNDDWEILQGLQDEANSRGDCVITVADLNLALSQAHINREPIESEPENSRKVATSLGRLFYATGSFSIGHAMKAKIISSIIELLFVILLAYGIYAPESNLVNITMLMAWILVFLGIASAITVMVLSVVVDNKKGDERQKLIEKLSQVYGAKKSKFRKAIGLIRVMIIIVLIAYVGWLFTAFSYAMVCLLMVVTRSCVEDSLGKYQASIE